jgi:mono/diheme cytochrome c family protein
MTMEGFIALGEEVFKGKGACTLCHDPLGVRAPVLDRMVVVASERLKDPGYRGGAEDAEGYIYESMVKPSAYVVAGYGVKGTGDSVSPMPDVSKGAIGLSEAEMRAVIAYLQYVAGVEVTAETP